MSKTKIPNILPDLDNDSKITLGIIGCFSAAGLILMSIFGKAGALGGIIGSFTVLILGKGAFLLPLAFIVAGLILIKLQKNQDLRSDLSSRLAWGMVFLIMSFNGFLSLFMGVETRDEASGAGGILGYLLYPYILDRIFGRLASFLVLGTMLVMGLFMISNMTFAQFISKIGQTIKDPGKFMDLIPDLFEFWNKKKKKQEEIINETKKKKSDKKESEDLIKATKDKEEKRAEIKKEEKPVEEEVKEEFEKLNRKKTFSFAENKDGVTEMREGSAPIDWSLPPFDLLKQSKSDADAGNIEKNKAAIKETLAHFGIEVEMKDAVIGPTVTQYTLKPANGVRLSAIDKLQRDLALALAAPNIRIEAPIPGKSLVGIEVPNKTKSDVRLRDLLQTNAFVNADDMPAAIGKDVAGTNLLCPITKMPHLLVAGATGAGKSVWLNGMLLSLLYKYSPTELQLILVDMKRVELKLYEGIPHLLTNVITNSEKAINALKWTVIEMDKRYQTLEDHGKRNIKDYNYYAERKDLPVLPYIVFVIDELADLMMLAKSEVEPIIVRLTQMARAVGIHVVLGTQRPDTSVVTGLIKANVPTRISFAVASQIDSRVVLDSSGAEKLLGQGDGLMLSPSQMHPLRFQGPNVEEIEVKRCVDFLKRQMEENKINANYKLEITEPPKKEIKIPGLEIKKEAIDGESVDEMYDEAKSMVIKYKKASASFLQQIMGIGYPKAAKYVMRMEEEGLIGPQNGSKPRDVYPPSDVEEEE